MPDTSYPPPETSPRKDSSGTRQIAVGFVVVFATFGLPFYAARYTHDLELLAKFGALAYVILPVLGLILTIFRGTRNFGLGLLFGGGALWVLTLAMLMPSQ